MILVFDYLTLCEALTTRISASNKSIESIDSTTRSRGFARFDQGFANSTRCPCPSPHSHQPTLTRLSGCALQVPLIGDWKGELVAGTIGTRVCAFCEGMFLDLRSCGREMLTLTSTSAGQSVSFLVNKESLWKIPCLLFTFIMSFTTDSTVDETMEAISRCVQCPRF